MKKVLSKTTDNDQTGFLNNRFIGENISLIDWIINFVDQEKILGMLVFLDFEKDIIEWGFIQKTFTVVIVF